MGFYMTELVEWEDPKTLVPKLILPAEAVAEKSENFASRESCPGRRRSGALTLALAVVFV
jgi:hypothetical protein